MNRITRYWGSISRGVVSDFGAERGLSGGQEGADECAVAA